MANKLKDELLLSENLLTIMKRPISEVLDDSMISNVSFDVKEGVTSTKLAPSTGTLPYAGSRVPKISDKDLELIKFKGNLEDFSRYKSAAQDLFGRYDSSLISYIRKFSYLKQTLPDKDQKRLLGYQQSEDGYNNFWADLEISYGSKSDAVFYWKRKLASIHKVATSGDGKIKLFSFRTHYEEAKIVLRHLNEHGKNGKQNHEEYLPLLTGKLDQGTAIEWGFHYVRENLKNSKEDVLQLYLDWIKAKLDVMTISNNDFKIANPLANQKASTSNGNGAGKKIEVNKTSVVPSVEVNKTVASGASGRGGSKNSRPSGGAPKVIKNVECKKCPFHLNKPHVLTQCPDFGNPKELWHKFYAYKDGPICQCCLRCGHLASKCPTKKACGKNGCKRAHHQKLHKACEDENFLKFADWKRTQTNSS